MIQHSAMRLVLTAWILTCGTVAAAKFTMTPAHRRSARTPKVSLSEIENLDSEALVLSQSLINGPIDAAATAVQPSGHSAPSDRGERERGACGLTAAQTQAKLKLNETSLETKISNYVAGHVPSQGSILIADSSWPKTCSASCHCAVYKTILEMAGAERLSEHDRRVYQELGTEAMNESLEAKKTCARSAVHRVCSKLE